MSTEKIRNSDIGKRLREFRRLRKLRQRHIAEAVGCTSGNISDIERGKSGGSPALVASICRHFGIDREWLTRGDGQMYKEVPIVAETPAQYLKGKRAKILCDVQKLLLRADDDTIDALERNVKEFLRIDPKKKEEDEE